MAKTQAAKKTTTAAKASSTTKKAAKPRAAKKTAAAAASPAKKTAAKPRKKTNGTTATPALAPSHEQVAAKAYEIWQSKGQPLGQDETNWAEAEAALRGAS